VLMIFKTAPAVPSGGYRDLHAGLETWFARKRLVFVIEEEPLLFGFEELFHICWTPFLGTFGVPHRAEGHTQ